jgi:hypothetical protein
MPGALMKGNKGPAGHRKRGTPLADGGGQFRRTAVFWPPFFKLCGYRFAGIRQKSGFFFFGNGKIHSIVIIYLYPSDSQYRMFRFFRIMSLLAIILLFLPLLLSGIGEAPESVNDHSTLEWREITPFPTIYFTDSYQDWLFKRGKQLNGASTEVETLIVQNSMAQPIFLNNDVIAFYGHPNSPNMGILGRYTPDELNTQLNVLAAEYNTINGQRGIYKAFYIIYGTVQPGGAIGYISDSLLQNYIRFAQEHSMLIFIDHQIGRYDPLDSLKEMLPYLHYPNVHLALDPEWRTSQPMVHIGSITGEEINQAQEIIQNYLVEHRLPGERMLVIHQFHYSMIENRKDVRTGFDRVTLVHCADGFGNPDLKRNTYSYLALAKNMPVKGFKLFYNFNIPGAGYDDPLLTPEQVLELKPRPSVILYQ